MAMGVDDPMVVNIDELQRCIMSVDGMPPDEHRAEYEREARVLDEQMTREARAVVAKLKATGYVDLGELITREEQTRANMWQQVVMGQGSDVEIYRSVCSSVVHHIMHKAMALEPSVSQVVGHYISLLQRQHSLAAQARTLSGPGAATPAVAVVPARPRAASDESQPGSTGPVSAGPAPGTGLGGVAVGMPTFRGSGPDAFTTSDTGSEFDPVSGAFVDRAATRRERNKLAAKGYRQRKQLNVRAAEAELEELRARTRDLEQENTMLRTENRILREQMGFFQSTLAGNLRGAAPPKAETPADLRGSA